VTYQREAGRVAAAMRALPSVDESVQFIGEIAGKQLIGACRIWAFPMGAAGFEPATSHV
jgi:hypothetical protein